MAPRRVAIVTGGSRGIGRAVALRLARNGDVVAVNYRNDETGAVSVVESIRAMGGEAFAVHADVAEVGEVRQMLKDVVARFGRLDVLVNNAGAIIRPSGWNEVGEAEWLKTLGVNLTGVLNCTRAAEPLLRESAGAAIVNLASTTGVLRPAAGVIAYGAAKAGVVSVTQSFAVALAPTIRVNCVAPGFIDTQMTTAAAPAFLRSQIDRTLLKRLGTGDEVADLVSFLAGPESAYITGQVVVIDGGHCLG